MAYLEGETTRIETTQGERGKGEMTWYWATSSGTKVRTIVTLVPAEHGR